MNNACSLPEDVLCGCCDGLTQETPQAIINRAALSAITYRTGTYSTFLGSMLAALSDPDLPALSALRTRDSSDFTIALLDAWAISLDVITFYQERFANEAFLRTAVDQRSVFELARLIGYVPSPGVAASAVLAFTLSSAPGIPRQRNDFPLVPVSKAFPGRVRRHRFSRPRPTLRLSSGSMRSPRRPTSHGSSAPETFLPGSPAPQTTSTSVTPFSLSPPLPQTVPSQPVPPIFASSPASTSIPSRVTRRCGGAGASRTPPQTPPATLLFISSAKKQLSSAPPRLAVSSARQDAPKT